MAQTIWITGASSGIGEACAYLYAKRHDRLLLTATRRERLETVAENCLKMGASEVSLFPYDLNDPEGISMLSLNAWEQFEGIDILVLNAGISQRTNVEDTSMAAVRQIMEVNYFAPVAIAKTILPKMIQAGGGRIAVTTSIAGLFGFPLRCAYSSSKHALYGFFETLQAEYHSQGINVTIVCPGRVQTNISINALDKDGEKHGTMDPGQAGGLSATQAAKKIVKAIDKKKREVMIGKSELIMAYIKRFMPGLCALLARRLNAM